MKLNKIEFSKSNFMTAEKDLFGIVQKLLGNENLKRLLYYPVKDVYNQPYLDDVTSLDLIHKNIRVVPRLSVEENIESYIIVTFDNFSPNANNPEYRDNIISFDIICHLDAWVLDNYQLRPYKIMGEIDGMLNGQKLNGIGTVDFIGGNQLLLNNELAGYTLTYRVINDV